MNCSASCTGMRCRILWLPWDHLLTVIDQGKIAVGLRLKGKVTNDELGQDFGLRDVQLVIAQVQMQFTSAKSIRKQYAIGKRSLMPISFLAAFT